MTSREPSTPKLAAVLPKPRAGMTDEQNLAVQLKQTQQENETLRKELAKANEMLSTANSELQKLDALEASLRALQSEYDTARKSWEREAANLKTQLEREKQQQREAAESGQSKQREKEQLSDRLARVLKEHEAQRAEWDLQRKEWRDRFERMEREQRGSSPSPSPSPGARPKSPSALRPASASVSLAAPAGTHTRGSSYTQLQEARWSEKYWNATAELEKERREHENTRRAAELEVKETEERYRLLQREMDKARDDKSRSEGEWERKYAQLNEQLKNERASFQSERKGHAKEVQSLFEQRDAARQELAALRRERDEREKMRERGLSVWPPPATPSSSSQPVSRGHSRRSSKSSMQGDPLTQQPTTTTAATTLQLQLQAGHGHLHAPPSPIAVSGHGLSPASVQLRLVPPSAGGTSTAHAVAAGDVALSLAHSLSLSPVASQGADSAVMVGVQPLLAAHGTTTTTANPSTTQDGGGVAVSVDAQRLHAAVAEMSIERMEEDLGELQRRVPAQDATLAKIVAHVAEDRRDAERGLHDEIAARSRAELLVEEKEEKLRQVAQELEEQKQLTEQQKQQMHALHGKIIDLAAKKDELTDALTSANNECSQLRMRLEEAQKKLAEEAQRSSQLTTALQNVKIVQHTHELSSSRSGSRAGSRSASPIRSPIELLPAPALQFVAVSNAAALDKEKEKEKEKQTKRSNGNGRALRKGIDVLEQQLLALQANYQRLERARNSDAADFQAWIEHIARKAEQTKELLGKLVPDGKFDLAVLPPGEAAASFSSFTQQQQQQPYQQQQTQPQQQQQSITHVPLPSIIDRSVLGFAVPDRLRSDVRVPDRLRSREMFGFAPMLPTTSAGAGAAASENGNANGNGSASLHSPTDTAQAHTQAQTQTQTQTQPAQDRKPKQSAPDSSASARKQRGRPQQRAERNEQPTTTTTTPTAAAPSASAAASVSVSFTLPELITTTSAQAELTSPSQPQIQAQTQIASPSEVKDRAAAMPQLSIATPTGSDDSDASVTITAKPSQPTSSAADSKRLSLGGGSRLPRFVGGAKSGQSTSQSKDGKEATPKAKAKAVSPNAGPGPGPSSPGTPQSDTPTSSSGTTGSMIPVRNSRKFTPSDLPPSSIPSAGSRRPRTASEHLPDPPAADKPPKPKATRASGTFVKNMTAVRKAGAVS